MIDQQKNEKKYKWKNENKKGNEIQIKVGPISSKKSDSRPKSGKSDLFGGNTSNLELSTHS